MVTRNKPGRKPKRIYLRLVRGTAPAAERPGGKEVRTFVLALQRVERLVAHGELTEPSGDFLLFRARDLPEARRVLRTDPWSKVDGLGYDLLEWDPQTLGAGVNLELPPARGSGRLTLLQRVGVVVSDREEAIRFYRDGLGLQVRTQEQDSGYIELSLGRGTAALSLIVPQPEWGEPHYSETKARLGSRTGIVFETDSVPALELRLKHLGAQITQESQPEPWGGRSLRFTDPDGNEFLAFDHDARVPR